ncbi:hypothetical protein C0J52_10131 [Blattella germanica]|nr:hypothetical protein C0J52_10131 [Blattella germanica]
MATNGCCYTYIHTYRVKRNLVHKLVIYQEILNFWSEKYFLYLLNSLYFDSIYRPTYIKRK